MHKHSMGSAPNYTNAALFWGGVNLFWVLLLLWQVIGFVAAIIAAAGVNYLIDRRAQNRS